MNFGLCCFDMLSQCGMRDTILGSVAFNPPKISYTLRLPLEKDDKKDRVVQNPLHVDDDDNRLHAIACSVHSRPQQNDHEILRQSRAASIRMTKSNLSQTLSLGYGEQILGSFSRSAAKKADTIRQTSIRQSSEYINNLSFVKQGTIRTQSKQDLRHMPSLEQNTFDKQGIFHQKYIKEEDVVQNNDQFNSIPHKATKSTGELQESFQITQNFPQYEVLLVSLEQQVTYKIPPLDRLSIKGYILSYYPDEKIASVYIQYTHKQSSNIVLLYSHGNSCDLGQCLDTLFDLAYNLKVNVFAYEYPGYGQSTGQTTDYFILRAARSAYNFLRNELGFSWRDIIFYGYSIGSGPSVTLASQPEYPCRGIVLHSSICSGLKTIFSKLSEENSHYYDIFPNSNLIKYINVPVFIIHGKVDQVSPFDSIKAMSSKVSRLFKLWEVDKGDHYNIDIIEPIRSNYFDLMKMFLQHLDVEFQDLQYRYKGHESQLRKHHQGTKWPVEYRHYYVRFMDKDLQIMSQKFSQTLSKLNDSQSPQQSQEIQLSDSLVYNSFKSGVDSSFEEAI